MTETKSKWGATGAEMTLNQVNNGCLAAGLSDAPTAAGLTGMLTTTFTKDAPPPKKIENRQRAAVVWKGKATLMSGVRGPTGQTGGRPQKGSGKSNKRLQKQQCGGTYKFMITGHFFEVPSTLLLCVVTAVQCL